MKTLGIAGLIVVLFFLTQFTGCGKGEDSNDGMETSEIMPLSETQVSNFVYVLPDILDFSDQYFARMTPSEKDQPDANKRYLRDLRQSAKIKEAASKYGFQTVDNLLQVYKNVVLEYTTIKRELTNFQAVSALHQTILEMHSNYTALLNKPNLTKVEEKKVTQQLDALKNDEARYYNILLVKKYEKELDRVSQNEQNSQSDQNQTNQ